MVLRLLGSAVWMPFLMGCALFFSSWTWGAEAPLGKPAPIKVSAAQPSVTDMDPGLRNRILTVAVTVSGPMVMQLPDGQWVGIAVSMWKHLAEKMGVRYEFRAMSQNEATQALKAREVDAAVGLFTVTPEKVEVLDFSMPYLFSGMDVAIKKPEERNSFAVIFSFLTSAAFLQILGGLLLLLLLVGTLIWLVERKSNKHQFHPVASRGVVDGIWWAAATMSTVGYGDITPRTLRGRLIAMAWMFIALVTSAIFVSQLVNELASQKKGSAAFSRPGDLVGKRVGALADSATAHYMRTIYNIQTFPFYHVRDGLRAVKEGKIDAYVGGEPTLHFNVKQFFNKDLEILKWNFGNQFYAIELPRESPLRKPIDYHLSQYLHTSEWADVQNFFSHHWTMPQGTNVGASPSTTH